MPKTPVNGTAQSTPALPPKGGGRRGRQKRKHAELTRLAAVTLATNYLVMPWRPEDFKGRVLYFDAGATSWTADLDWGRHVLNHEMVPESSLAFIWKEFRQRGWEVDMCYAWEPAGNASKVWADLPTDILPRMAFHGYGIDIKRGNPLDFVRKHARKEDFVIFKLDIDTPALETAIVKQLLAEPDLWELVDEFFWEHHTLGNPLMQRHIGWLFASDEIKKHGEDLSQSYEYFRRLREVGIRAHSWV
eukprot:Hpha_TRINITY_DN15071_c0_g2::TRINITY_DN15071_c0_g2_i2::g.125299::m.125299